MVKTISAMMIFLVCICSGCRGEQEKNVVVEGKMPEKIKIVAVGDSLTAGYGLDESKSYPALLEKKLKSDGFNVEVINAGVSAETSSGTRSRIDWILTMDPDIVILETGANDGLRGIDPLVVEKNIREILEILKRKEIVTILSGMKMVWNLGPVYVRQFNGVYPKLEREFEVVFFPFFLEDVAMKRELNLGDGLHPNENGYEIITENVYPYVLKAIEKWGER